MQVTGIMVAMIMDTTGCSGVAATEAMRRLAELIDPIPEDVIALHDTSGRMWRRQTGSDGNVWITAGRANCATSRFLFDHFGPLKYVARADGNAWENA